MSWARALAAAYAVFASTAPLNYINITFPNPATATASILLLLISLAMFRRGFLAASKAGLPVAGAATAARLALLGILVAIIGIALLPHVRGSGALFEAIFLGMWLLGAIVGMAAMAVSLIAGSVRIGRYLKSSALTVLSYILSISITLLLIATLMGPYGADVARAGFITEGVSAALISALLLRRRKVLK